MNFSLITLGELLSSQNEIIKRNAFSILKVLQKEREKESKIVPPFIYHKNARYIDCKGINTEYCDRCGYTK